MLLQIGRLESPECPLRLEAGLIYARSTNPFDSDCEIPASQPAPSVEKKKQRKKVVDKTKKRTKTNAPNELELGGEPLRAAALRSFLSRCSGSGYTLQRDPTRQGNYYVELRVYNAREAEALSTDRWKQALVTFKSARQTAVRYGKQSQN
ncbi:unnamed protein product [Arctia plantaginis]|uniref:Uncharacterized protein n=1 Tax=Arctia plantaginis TaxID=874455 RepID=A0A8S1ATE4_ARCPL|nr:unnamed protein product [Arctia plantaginis]